MTMAETLARTTSQNIMYVAASAEKENPDEKKCRYTNLLRKLNLRADYGPLGNTEDTHSHWQTSGRGKATQLELTTEGKLGSIAAFRPTMLRRCSCCTPVAGNHHLTHSPLNT